MPSSGSLFKEAPPMNGSAKLSVLVVSVVLGIALTIREARGSTMRRAQGAWSNVTAPLGRTVRR